jgi:hypothetical protein
VLLEYLIPVSRGKRPRPFAVDRSTPHLTFARLSSQYPIAEEYPDGEHDRKKGQKFKNDPIAVSTIEIVSNVTHVSIPSIKRL